MADTREYAYFVRGRDIAIMEADVTSLPNTIFVGDSLWKSPKATVDDGLLLVYVSRPKAKDGGEIQDESDDIDINERFEKALVYYLKARYAEDVGDFDKREYFMREFNRLTMKVERSKSYGLRVITPGQFAIR